MTYNLQLSYYLITFVFTKWRTLKPCEGIYLTVYHCITVCQILIKEIHEKSYKLQCYSSYLPQHHPWVLFVLDSLSTDTVAMATFWLTVEFVLSTEASIWFTWHIDFRRTITRNELKYSLWYYRPCRWHWLHIISTVMQPAIALWIKTVRVQ